MSHIRVTLLKVNFMIRIKLMSYLRRETHKRSRATHNGRVGGLIVRWPIPGWLVRSWMLLRTNWCVRGEGAVVLLDALGIYQFTGG